MQGQRADSSKGRHARLPALAPGDETKSSSSSSSRSGSSSLNNASTDSRRARLPPRSKSGCWTCGARKVKCDEKRPECGQCLRLGHVCDYNPRLAFRDDTPRIVERMRETFTVGDSLFDGSSPTEYQPNRSLEDLLPPFAALTTDEERERKAESQNPGTYHVVTNPTTFADLPEYQEERNTASEAKPHLHLVPGHQGEETSYSSSRNDPNTVILRSFSNTPDISPVTPSQANFPSRPPLTTRAHSSVSNVSSNSSVVRQGGSDNRLLQFYRTTISPHIAKTRTPEQADIFETQARTYPPLFHAMMALSAMGLANRSGFQSANALEHYQQVIPALQSAVQSTEDAFSDGALFTHFILLLYEIAAGGNVESNMWQHHCDHLMRIFSLRRQAHGIEPYGFLLWTIFTIDIYALLSMGGTATFAETVKQNMLPSPEDCLPSPAFIHPDEQLYFPVLPKLNQEVVLLALQVGQLARTSRAETRRNFSHQSQHVLTNRRQSRIQELHHLMRVSRTVWRSQWPGYKTMFSGPEPPPQRAFAWTMHSYMLYRACMIYAHTSMYPAQRSSPTPDSESELRDCCREIINAAQVITSRDQFEFSYMVFPLFMAGFASKDPVEKEQALELIKAVETHSYGGSTKSVRVLLENIYGKQSDAIAQNGDEAHIDWAEEMERSGQRIIMYGL